MVFHTIRFVQCQPTNELTNPQYNQVDNCCKLVRGMVVPIQALSLRLQAIASNLGLISLGCHLRHLRCSFGLSVVGQDNKRSHPKYWQILLCQPQRVQQIKSEIQFQPLIGSAAVPENQK